VITAEQAQNLFRVQDSWLTLNNVKITTGSKLAYCFVLQTSQVDITDFKAESLTGDVFISNSISSTFRATRLELTGCNMNLGTFYGGS
jgi:hypothetical protein